MFLHFSFSVQVAQHVSPPERESQEAGLARQFCKISQNTCATVCNVAGLCEGLTRFAKSLFAWKVEVSRWTCWKAISMRRFALWQKHVQIVQIVQIPKSVAGLGSQLPRGIASMETRQMNACTFPAWRSWTQYENLVSFFFLQSSANKLTSPFSLSTGCWSQQLSPVGTGGKPADSLEKVPAAKVWLYPTGSGGRFEMMESNHHWYYQDLKRDRYIFFSFTWWICTGFCRILLDDVGRQRSKPGTCLGFSMFTSCLSVSAQRIALPCRCRACCVPLLVTSQSLRSLDRRKHTRKVARREPECGNVRQTKLCCAQCWNLCCQSQFSFRLGLCACQMQTSRTEMILIWWDALQKNFLSTAG